MGFYHRFILPPLIDLACSRKAVDAQRAKIVPWAEGVVLELGFGSGLSLPHYDPSRVEKLYALEPSPGMLVRARKRASGAAVPVEVLCEPAEAISLPPESVDTVVVTYALCTIPDPAAALAGARRMLKRGGRLLFCEHGIAPDPRVRTWQRRIEPVWRRIAGGCHLTRDPGAMVRAAGFAVDRLETMYLPRTPRWAGFTTWGAARPA